MAKKAHPFPYILGLLLITSGCAHAPGADADGRLVASPAPEFKADPPQPVRFEEGRIIPPEPICFAPGTDVVLPQSLEALDRLAAALLEKGRPAGLVRVEVRPQERGGDSELELSRRRAQALSYLLQERGLSEESLVVADPPAPETEGEEAELHEGACAGQAELFLEAEGETP